MEPVAHDSSRQFDSFLPWWKENHSGYNGLLIDLDGTMMTKGVPLPGSPALLDTLRRQDFPFCFLTNDGDHSRQEKSHILRQGGLAVESDEIISCSQGLNIFVEEKQTHRELFFVMGMLGTPCYAENAGLTVTRDIARLNQCKGVIVGEGEYDWYTTISAVVNFFLHNPEGHFLIPNPDTYWPDGDSNIGIGAGGKARFICTVLKEAGIALAPTYLGKPHTHIYDFAAQHLGEKYFNGKTPAPSSLLALGDSLHSDVTGANLYGASSGLLLTGITTPEILQHQGTGTRQPDLVFTSL